MTLTYQEFLRIAYNVKIQLSITTLHHLVFRIFSSEISADVIQRLLCLKLPKIIRSL
jgi:hypothetical protein